MLDEGPLNPPTFWSSVGPKAFRSSGQRTWRACRGSAEAALHRCVAASGLRRALAYRDLSGGCSHATRVDDLAGDQWVTAWRRTAVRVPPRKGLSRPDKSGNSPSRTRSDGHAPILEGGRWPLRAPPRHDNFDHSRGTAQSFSAPWITTAQHRCEPGSLAKRGWRPLPLHLRRHEPLWPTGN